MADWIRRRKGASGSIRLFCFAQAGGGASNFARWQREAPAERLADPLRILQKGPGDEINGCYGDLGRESISERSLERLSLD